MLGNVGIAINRLHLGMVYTTYLWGFFGGWFTIAIRSLAILGGDFQILKVPLSSLGSFGGGFLGF